MQNIKNEFEENGFFVAKSLIPDKLISAIFDQIGQLLDEALQLKKVDLSAFQNVDEKYMYLKRHYPKIKSHVYDLIKHLDGVRTVSTLPALLQIIKGLTNSSLLLDGTQLRINDGDNDGLIPFHQEIKNTFSDQCIAAWIPLVDLTIEKGALRFVPKSHKQGYVTHSQIDGYPAMDETYIDPSKIEYACLNKGDALIFHRHLYHASNPNQSTQIRWTFITRYNPFYEIPYLEEETAPIRVPYPEF
mgnify:CR=1 FL=1